MKEDFLHYVWRTRSFDFLDLRSTQGQRVHIVKYGEYNRDSGPDFLGAVVEVDGTLWAGNVEMHLCSSLWDAHGHSDDPAYQNVILHVVLEDDMPVFIDKERIPCIEMRRRIQPALLRNYLKLIHFEKWVPCESVLPSVPEEKVRMFVHRAGVERLEQRSAFVSALHEYFNGDWEQVFFTVLMRAWGFGRNSEPMEALARRLSVKTVKRIAPDLKRIESLIFGMAGLLNSVFTDKYAADLHREFKHLTRMYELRPIETATWSWGRMRPSNLPSIRLAQVSMLLATRPGIMRDILNSSDLREVASMLKVGVSEYWRGHTKFDREAKLREHRMGGQSVHRLITNAVVPFMFVYGTATHREHIRERALAFAEALPSESNRITRKWEALGVENDSAASSQGLIQLKTAYCDARRCTECAIGHYILNSTSDTLNVR